LGAGILDAASALGGPSAATNDSADKKIDAEQ
jgi:hypothetical protein